MSADFHVIGPEHPAAQSTREHAHKLLSLILASQGTRYLQIDVLSNISKVEGRTLVTRYDNSGTIHLYLVTNAEAHVLEETGHLPEDCE